MSEDFKSRGSNSPGKGEPDPLKSGPAPTPGHMVMQELSAKSYQHYVASLKKGGKSGISETFGSAADIFGLEVTCSEEKFDPAEYEPKDSDESKVRKGYLAEQVKQHSRKFLERHLSQWHEGAYPESKCSQSEFSERTFATVWKAISATVLLMMAVEQVGKDAPEWLKAYLWGCLNKTEQIAENPSVDHLLNVLLADGMQLSTVCRNGANSICATLGFGLVGEPAWTAVYDFLGSVPRVEYLKQSLVTPVRELPPGATL